MRKSINARWGYLLVLAFILLLPTLIKSPYTMILLNQAGVFVIIVLGLYFTLGLTGQLSLAQAAFWGIGAYTAAILTKVVGLPIPVAMIAAAVLAGVMGIIVGVPTLKLKGLYLAMVTIAFVQIVYLVLLNWMDFTGGPNGISRIPTPNLGFIQLNNSWNYFYLVVAFVVLLVWFARNVTESSLGRAMMAVRESQIAAEAMGINASRVKIIAFVFSAVYAGIAGSLYVHRMTYVNPLLFTYDETIRMLSALLIGGRHSVVGALVGGSLLYMLPEWLRFMQKYYMAIYGGAIVLAMVFLPLGVVGVPSTIAEALRRRRGVTEEVKAEPVDRQIVQFKPRLDEVSADQPLLVVDNVTQRFGGLVAVREVSIDIRPGEIRGLIGPNGSGKTTLMNVISGIYTPGEGRIKFKGHEIVGTSVHKIAQLGLCRTFQTIRLFDHMSVLANVMAAHYAQSKSGLGHILFRTPSFGAEERHFAERSLAALDAVGIADAAEQRAGTLPYGKRRLLEIARAIATDANLILLDEPAAGMNPAEKEHLISVIARLRDIGITIMLIEHDMNVVMSLADRIACLNFGMKIADGNPREIQGNELVIEAYLGRKRANA